MVSRPRQRLVALALLVVALLVVVLELELVVVVLPAVLVVPCVFPCGPAGLANSIDPRHQVITPHTQ